MTQFRGSFKYKFKAIREILRSEQSVAFTVRKNRFGNHSSVYEGDPSHFFERVREGLVKMENKHTSSSGGFDIQQLIKVTKSGRKK